MKEIPTISKMIIYWLLFFWRIYYGCFIKRKRQKDLFFVSVTIFLKIFEENWGYKKTFNKNNTNDLK